MTKSYLTNLPTINTNRNQNDVVTATMSNNNTAWNITEMEKFFPIQKINFIFENKILSFSFLFLYNGKIPCSKDNIFLMDEKSRKCISNSLGHYSQFRIKNARSTREPNFFRPRVFTKKRIKNLKISIQNVYFKKDRLYSSDIIFTMNEILQRIWTKI